MLFIPEFPWSDLHTLNLDWLLSVVANHERQLQDLEGSASPYDEAPLADGAADPGNVNQFARGNHRHPTDTTRASVAALQAVQDSVPGPSNGNPRMDGAANPGTYTYYSRADHVHPSDTSKLDKTGGEVNGLLDILPRRCYAELSSAGWYKVLTYDSNGGINALGSSGAIIDIYITRRYSAGANEVHKVTLLCRYNGMSFVGEESSAGVLEIDKIRWCYETGNTTRGHLDIHYNYTDSNVVSVKFNVRTHPQYQQFYSANALESVADSPSGETVLTEYTFMENTDAVATPTLGEYATSFASGDCVRKINGIVYLRVNVTVKNMETGSWRTVFSVPTQFRPRVNYDFFVIDNSIDGPIHARVESNGDIKLFPKTAIPSGRIIICYITYPII